jgi:tetratricopeptide (TPR) repeat protein
MMKQAILKTLTIAALIASVSTQRPVRAEATLSLPSPAATKGMKEFFQGDMDAALNSLNAGIQANPQDSQAYHNRAAVYMYKHSELNGESEEAAKKSEYLDKAFADTNQAIKIDPDNFFALKNRGTIRYWRGDLNGASSDYIKSYNIVPLPSTALLRGIVFARMGDKQSALALLHEAADGLKAQGSTKSYQMALDEIKKLEQP